MRLRRAAYRAFRSSAALQHVLVRRLTPAGRLVLAALAAAAIIGPNTRLTVAYQAFTFLVALLAIATALSARVPPRLGVRRRLPRFGTAGEPLVYTVTLQNPTGRLQSGLVLMEDLEDPRPTFEAFVTQREPGEERRNWFDRTVGFPRWAWLMARARRAAIEAQPLPPLPSRQEVDVRIEVTPVSRGSLRFTGVTVARPDPLGLVRSLAEVPAPASILVLPRRYPLPRFELPGARRHQPGGVALASSVGDSEEFLSLRDYRPGDPLRRIHWRSWARAGRPVVKELHDEFFVRHALLLDTFLPPGGDARFEEAVSVAASFVGGTGSQEALLDLMFVGPEAYTFTAGRGVGHVDRMLEVLASVRPCTDRAFAALADLVVSRHTGLSGAICVFLAWDDARRSLIDTLRGLGVPVLVLLVEDAAVPGTAEPDGVHRLTAGNIAQGLARL
ncbi:MAG: DUF58 domain-containing protein [Candidatus Rokuibacteriota bacterium]